MDNKEDNQFTLEQATLTEQPNTYVIYELSFCSEWINKANDDDIEKKSS